MSFPVRPEDVRIIQGRSKGLQVLCSCGCINFGYLDPQETTWRCRNCRRVFSNDFPRLLESTLVFNKGEEAVPNGAVVKRNGGVQN